MSEYNDALKAAAKFCEFYAEERITLAGDSVLLDPCLSGQGFTQDNIAMSKQLQVEGLVTSSSYHAALQLAEHIRAMKRGAA